MPELSALGGSEVPGEGLAVADGAATVAALIEGEFGGRPVTLAGNSLGAWIAVRLALERPDLVDRLVLVAAAGYRDQDWERIRDLITVRDTADVTALLPALFAHVPAALHLARRAFRAAYTSPAVTSALAKLEAHDTFGDEDLARIEVPTALIWGEEDGLFHLETARRMAAALPQATLYPLPGCAHALHWERPQALVEAVANFRRASALPASPQRRRLTDAGPGTAMSDPRVPRLPRVRDPVLRLRMGGRQDRRGPLPGLRQRGPGAVRRPRRLRRADRTVRLGLGRGLGNSPPRPADRAAAPGSMRAPRQRTPKWRWGPVARPVEPTRPRTLAGARPPAPPSRRSSLRWKNMVIRPSPWSRKTLLPEKKRSPASTTVPAAGASTGVPAAAA